MQVKTKQQKEQEKRLSAAKMQAKKNKADLKATKSRKSTKPPEKKQGGFFDRILAKLFGRNGSGTAYELSKRLISILTPQSEERRQAARERALQSRLGVKS